MGAFLLMAYVSHKIDVFSNGNIVVDQAKLLRHKDDMAIYGGPRDKAPCPAVWWLDEDQMQFTEQWQYYVAAINYKMSLQYVSALFNNSKALFNQHGFPTDPQDRDIFANYILRENLEYPLPVYQKVFTCSFNTHEELSRWSVPGGQTLITFNTLNGKEPPLMKPGKVHPKSAEEAQLRHDDYLILPETHRKFFFVPNNVSLTGRVFPFPNGATYDFTLDDRNYTFFPFVSVNLAVDFLSNWTEVQPTALFPSPYSS